MQIILTHQDKSSKSPYRSNMPVDFSAEDFIFQLLTKPEVYEKTFWNQIRRKLNAQSKPPSLLEIQQGINHQLKSVAKSSTPTITLNRLGKRNLGATLKGIRQADGSVIWSKFILDLTKYNALRFNPNEPFDNKVKSVKRLIAKLSKQTQIKLRALRGNQPLLAAQADDEANLPAEPQIQPAEIIIEDYTPLRPKDEVNPVYHKPEAHKTSLFTRLRPYLDNPYLHGIFVGTVIASALTFIGAAPIAVAGYALLAAAGLVSIELIYNARQNKLVNSYIEYQKKPPEELRKLETLLALNTGIKAKHWGPWAKSFFITEAWTHYPAYAAGLMSTTQQDDTFIQRIERLSANPRRL